MRWLAAAALLVLLLLPAVLNSYAVTVFIFIFFYAFLGQAWNIVGGYAGQLSAGHAAFVGIGAYTSAVLSVQAGLTPWIGMLVGGLLSAVLGTIVGYLGFRFGLRGFYFVLLTVAFAEVCRIVALNTDAVGGALGYYITFTGNPWQFQFQDNRVYYYVALGLMLIATGIVAAIERRRFGAYLIAIREDESACEALGVNTFRYKMLAMIVSSFLTGVGGTFYAFYLFSLQPGAVFGIPLSVEIIIRPIVGGAGTVMGPILGSFILSPLAEVSRIYFGQGGWAGAHLIAYGAPADRGRALPAAGRLPGAAPPLDARRPMSARATRLLDVAGISKRFGGLVAVRDLSLEMSRGEVLGLIGPNGAGKTTAFNLLSGFLAPDQGAVHFDGHPLVGLKPHAICALGLARTFQIVRPFPHLSVLDNVRVGALARHPRMADAREKARAVIDAGGAGRQGRARGVRAHAGRAEAARARARAGHRARLAPARRGDGRAQPHRDRGDRGPDPAHQRGRRLHPADRAQRAGGDDALAPHRGAQLRREDRGGPARHRRQPSPRDRGLPGRGVCPLSCALTASRSATAT